MSSVADWYKRLIKTSLLALKTTFTQRCHDAITVTWRTRHFRHFTSEQNKVSKSEVVEKVIPVADFSVSADNICQKFLKLVDV